MRFSVQCTNVQLLNKSHKNNLNSGTSDTIQNVHFNHYCSIKIILHPAHARVSHKNITDATSQGLD